MKILIAGGTGLLGSTLSRVLASQGHEVIVHSGSKGNFVGDFTLAAQCDELLSRVSPEVIVNLICLSDVNKCEENPDLSYRLNVKTVENIAAWIKNETAEVHLIQISTDHVYDAKDRNREEDICIRNNYALSKLCAEKVAETVGATVLRTNFFGRSEATHRVSFSDWIISALNNREAVTLFDDVYFSPLAIETLSQLISLVATKKIPGVFNLGAATSLSKRDFAFAVAEHFGRKFERVNECSIDSANLVKRPKNMAMNSEKFEVNFGIKLPTLIDEIAKL